MVNRLWLCRNQVLWATLFFFCLSMAGNTPYGHFELLGISFVFAVVLGIISFYWGMLSAADEWDTKIFKK